MPVYVTGRGQVHVRGGVSEPRLRDPRTQGTKQTHTDPDKGRSQGRTPSSQKRHRGQSV